MTQKKDLFLARLGSETAFVLAESLEEAQEKLRVVLDELDIERREEEITWFKTDHLGTDDTQEAFIAQETHLGILEQSGEVQIFKLSIEGQEDLYVIARSQEEVLEHMANWITRTKTKPPVKYTSVELEEEAAWVYRLKEATK